ncbi:hypothetical protein CR513_08881, partial [Mucuna pruriens]
MEAPESTLPIWNRQQISQTFLEGDDSLLVNPKVKVRVPEQEEEFVYPENNSGTWTLSKFIELLHFEEEKNQSECPPSIFKSTKACPQHVTMRSTPSSKEGDLNDGSTCTGVLKSSKRVGESSKENARACSVIRPRAVLSSPENDGLVGSINDLNNSISSSHKKNDARCKIEGKYSDREGYEAFKGKTPLKPKVHVRNF